MKLLWHLWSIDSEWTGYFRDAVTNYCLPDSKTQASFTRALKGRRTTRRERQREKNRAYLQKEHIRCLKNGEKRLIECIRAGKQIEMLRGHHEHQDLEEEISNTKRTRLIMQCDTVLSYCRVKLKALRNGTKITEKAVILEVIESSIYNPSFSAVRSWFLQLFEFDESNERAFTFGRDDRGRNSKETLIDDPDVAAQLKMFCLQKLKSLTVRVVRKHINDNILNAQDVDQQFIIKEEQLEKFGILNCSICNATAHEWMLKIGCKAAWHKKSFYVDNHESERALKERARYLKSWEETQLYEYVWLQFQPWRTRSGGSRRGSICSRQRVGRGRQQRTEAEVDKILASIKPTRERRLKFSGIMLTTVVIFTSSVT